MRRSEILSPQLARDTISALAPAARAFTKAQNRGNVWIGAQGTFETIESTDLYTPRDPPNPDQLRLV